MATALVKKEKINLPYIIIEYEIEKFPNIGSRHCSENVTIERLANTSWSLQLHPSDRFKDHENVYCSSTREDYNNVYIELDFNFALKDDKQIEHFETDWHTCTFEYFVSRDKCGIPHNYARLMQTEKLQEIIEQCTKGNLTVVCKIREKKTYCDKSNLQRKFKVFNAIPEKSFAICQNNR